MRANSPYYDAYLVRHGETDWNAKGLLQGHADIPLNEKGREQALALQKSLLSVDLHGIFTSDLSRAFETASIIAKGRSLPILKTKDLRERFMGSLEGVAIDTFNQTIADPFYESEIAMERELFLSTPWHEELESTAAIYKRVSHYLYSHLHTFHQKQLLICSHGGVLKALLDHLDFAPKKRWIIENCGYLKLRISSNHLSLIQTQGVRHKEY